MERIDFQRQILSQILVTDLQNSLLSFEENKENATKIVPYVLASNTLDDAQDANALALLTELLSNLRIPHQILDILRLYTRLGEKISQVTWDYFYNYTFTGRIETKFQVDTSGLTPGARPLFAIIAEDAIVDILHAPLNMLLGFIEHICSTWKELQAIGAITYYLPKHHSDLFIYIEGHVADYYGAMHPFDAGIATPQKNIFNGYRFIGVIDEYPFDARIIDVAKQVAFNQAQSTNS
ncbi:hypothetical protein ACVWYN_001084 [Pedobacter sp. UYP24]